MRGSPRSNQGASPLSPDAQFGETVKPADGRRRRLGSPLKGPRDGIVPPTAEFYAGELGGEDASRRSS